MKKTSLPRELIQNFADLGVLIPEILIPAKNLDYTKWSVVACDQYTSDHEYWADVESQCQGAKSTLHLTIPEIYLKSPDLEDRIKKILSNMDAYLNESSLESQGIGVMYIERRTHSGLRQGLILGLDLEAYDYSPDSKTPIRATEGTIVDRIPPRLKVRAKAALELPHIMVLIDDPGANVIEKCRPASNIPASYHVDLMKHGGSLDGWFINDESSLNSLSQSLSALRAEVCKRQNTTNPLFFAMGDGNHSLATAKASWENIKKDLRQSGISEIEIMQHPARYALVELVNIHSSGLHFEPIHRAIFTQQSDTCAKLLAVLPELESCVKAEESYIRELIEKKPEGQNKLGFFDGKNWILASLKKDSALLPPALADLVYERLKETDKDAEVDFIHGWTDTTRLCNEGAVALMVPVLARDLLFSRVQAYGPLPRKAFSMGEAEEKRYYFEARRIRK